MKNEKPNNPPAFPRPIGEYKDVGSGGWNRSQSGMTLRDYFAAKADIPWNAVIETLEQKGLMNPTIQDVIDYRAEVKFLEADAMLKQREQ